MMRHYPTIVLLICLYLPSLGCSETKMAISNSSENSIINEGAPLFFYAGTYEIVGREFGNEQKTYKGWARLILNEKSDELLLDRCINGEYSKGKMYRRITDHTYTPVLEANFTFFGESFKETCLDLTDTANYPRMTCFTYPQSDPYFKTPGLETYFPIHWKVPEDYFECN